MGQEYKKIMFWCRININRILDFKDQLFIFIENYESHC